MKNSGLKNRFPIEVRSVFSFNYSCFNCGQSKPLELHHILGTCSDSILNAAPLCRECHNKVYALGYELVCKLLKATIKFVLSEGYKLNRKDTIFYLRNRKYYA